MRDGTLIGTGVAGAVVAAVCCTTPLLAIFFGALGLTAWLSKADYFLVPVFVLCAALLGIGVCRRWLASGRHPKERA